MKTIAHVTQLSEKGVRPLNEDSVLADERNRLFGIFDGASSLDSFLSADGQTGAYIASHIARDTFLNSKLGLVETLRVADNAIDEAHRANQIDASDAVNRFSTTVATIKITDDSVELLQVGDSVIVVIQPDGHVSMPLEYDDHDLEIMRKWRQLAAQGKTDIRQAVAEDVIELRKLGNKTYGTLNGDGAATNFAQTITIKLEDIASILIMSDGMFIPKADPDAAEDWNLYAKLYHNGGLRMIYETVRRLEESDLELNRYPRYKLHDDASGVAVDFT